jgi:hypothetical protein
MSDAPFLHLVEWLLVARKHGFTRRKLIRKVCSSQRLLPGGFGHIAFLVDDVLAAREAVLAAGRQPVGK